jgi:hypothetical protein
LIILAGTIDLGRAFFTYMVLRDAAQEGAAYGSVARTEQLDTIPCTAIEDRVRSTSDNPVDLNGSEIEVNVNFDGVQCSVAAATSACFGRDVQVEVSYDEFPLVTPFLGAIIGSQTISLSATVADTVLTPPCD